MNTKMILSLVVVTVAMILPSSGSAIPAFDPSYVAIRDEYGEVLYEQMTEPSNPLLLKTIHYLRLAPEARGLDARPGGGSDPGTDCESDSYKLAGWFWDTAYRAQASSNGASVGNSLGDWDAATSANLGGSVSGGSGPTGVLDGVNQIAWSLIGASSTVAVTTTWSYRGSGIAVESDGQYNTYYPWATNGASNAMDVESVTQHETGHTYGLNHPSGSGIDCLSMYAYVNYGWTHGRTLGDGDILGIKAIYG